MLNVRYKICGILASSFLLMSCSHLADDKTKQRNIAVSEIESAINAVSSGQSSSDQSSSDQSSSYGSASAETNQSILNSLLPTVPTNPNIQAEERFDVSVKNIDAKNFLLGLVDSTNFNMVVSPEVNTKISLQLKNVTIDEVLNAVEKIYPLMVEKQGNLYFVSSAESMTMVYPLDYLNVSREGKSQTYVAGQAISSGQGSSNQQASSSGNRSSGNNSNVQQVKSSEITTESKSDFWTELASSLDLIVKNEPNANIVVSPQAGVVVVKALPNTQKLIQEYLNITQSNLNRQVILEAKIIEVSLNEGFQSGIDWRKINTVNSDDTVFFGQQGQVLNQAQSDTPLNGMFSMLYGSTSFEAAIDLLETQGDVQVLSSPRVSTVNNQKAVIKVGSDEFFVTEVSTTTVTGTSTATTPNVTLTQFFSGISLDVTPQINRKGEIILHIHPVVSEVDDQQKTLTLGSDQFTLPLALSNVRESDSIVRTEDEQVVVIGGLMQNKVQKMVNSTPIVSEIPLVGKLFEQSRDAVIKSELVILLKANIVDNDYRTQSLEDAKSRFGQF